MTMKKLLCLLAAIPALATAQQKEKPAKTGYPLDYFRNPVDIPIYLAGNFGECRPGHFHSGIDIKTLGKENQPVHAAADGYVSRIKMEKGGFGHGLYITHPNGYTTLYAHLNKFAPAIQKYLETQQYDQKKWNLDLQLSPMQFPVKKGQQIAWSGNTGASSAPHLHFEIRNTKTEHPLNPELFGLPITDKIPPTPVEVVFYKGNVYEDNTVTVTLAKKGNEYKPVKTDNNRYGINNNVVDAPAGFTGIGINADDFMDGSDNTITFYTAQLYMDDSLQAQVTLDDVGYDETRYINAYADFKTKQQRRKWVQCLFQLPGNRLNNLFQNLNQNRGRLNLTDNKQHNIHIVLTDDNGNESVIAFKVNPVTVAADSAVTAPCTPFKAAQPNTFTDANIAFSLDDRQLYDDICFRYSSKEWAGGYSNKYSLHEPYVPLHHYFDLQIKPNKPIPFDLRSKVTLMYSDNKDEDGRAATATDKGWYKASVRNFGVYWLDIDTIPPTIKPIQKDGANLSKAKQITFEVKDAMTSVKTFGGYLDGKWICFEQHANLCFYAFDSHCPKGKHDLTFKAEDENGNVNTVHLSFTR